MFQRTEHPKSSNYITNTFLHHRYSNRVKLLFSFLMAGVCVTLFQEITNGDSIIKSGFDLFTVYPVFTVLFFLLFVVLNGKKSHRFVITPLLYFAFGYSLASIVKTLFGLDMNLFTLTYWTIGILFVYSLLFRKFYTFAWYMFDSVISIVCSFFIAFFVLTIVAYFNALPENGGYLGVFLFTMFHVCYLYFFRHRFSVLSGILSLPIAYIGTIVAYELLDSHFSFHNIIHSLYGGFIFTTLYAVCISFFTLFTKQPKVFPLIRGIDKADKDSVDYDPELTAQLSWKKGPDVIYVKTEVDNTPPQYTGQHSSDYYDGYNEGLEEGRRDY